MIENDQRGPLLSHSSYENNGKLRKGGEREEDEESDDYMDDAINRSSIRTPVSERVKL